MILQSEKLKKYRTFAKYCKRNEIKEAKIIFFNGMIIDYVSRSRTIK